MKQHNETGIRHIQPELENEGYGLGSGTNSGNCVTEGRNLAKAFGWWSSKAQRHDPQRIFWARCGDCDPNGSSFR